MLYFAYGSNLDQFQMAYRCPAAAFAGTATLLDHALAFAGYSSRWDGPVATLLSIRGTMTRGALYDMSAEDFARLDKFEGCPFAYMRSRKMVRADDGRRRWAEVYFQTSVYRLAKPSNSYAGTIRHAYRRLGFDLRALRLAEAGRAINAGARS
jgi:cation transport regulator ChaC